MTNLTTTDLIAQARALEALDRARTQGEWYTYRSYTGAPMDVGTPDTHPRSAERLGKSVGSGGYCRALLSVSLNSDPKCEPPSDRDADAAFIAAAPRAFALLRQLCDRLEALQKEAPHENAWLCERGDNGPTRYVCINPSGFFDWTEDVNKALRLCRREDADAVAAIVDDCWRVAEHRWG